MNISNYLFTSVGQAPSTATVGITGATGDAVAFSTLYGYPFATTGYDMSGFEGIRATAVIFNSTYAALQPGINSATSGSGVLTTSSGWAVTASTLRFTLALATSYSTTLTTLVYDLYRPQARFVNFYCSIPTSSGLCAIIVDQYGSKRDPSATPNSTAFAVGQFVTGTTIFVSPATG